MAAKPEGIAETEELLRKLVQVPKRELDRHLAAKRKKRAAKRKKQS